MSESIGNSPTLFLIDPDCTRCALGHTRTKLVIGEGSLQAGLMLVGEAPGHDEDISGRPFVGRAGKLLDKAISNVGLDRHDVFIANILKCRPPANRKPLPEEILACLPYLHGQIAVIKPRAIVLLGATASEAFLGRPVVISKERGTVVPYQVDSHHCHLIPTFHPSYILRRRWEQDKLESDLVKAVNLLGGENTGSVFCGKVNISSSTSTKAEEGSFWR